MTPLFGPVIFDDRIAALAKAAAAGKPPAVVPDPTPALPLPVAPDIKPKRAHMCGSYLDFAMEDHDSEAAKILGIDTAILNPEDIADIKARERKANAQEPGFFAAIWDNIVSFFQSLFSAKTFAATKAERQSLRSATHLYEALSEPSPDGSTPYAGFAKDITGVEPDGKGAYKPVLDASGQPKGQYKHLLDAALHPQESGFAEAVDRGAIPSRAQLDHMEAIYKEEALAFYRKPEIFNGWVTPRPGVKVPDTEARDFMKTPEVEAKARSIVQRMIDEVSPEGKFDIEKHRNQYIGRVKERMQHDHKQLRADAEKAGVLPDAPVITPVDPHHGLGAAAGGAAKAAGTTTRPSPTTAPHK